MCNKLQLDISIPLKDNALLKHYPFLFQEWDFKKNEEIGLDIYKISKSSGKKAWWYCEKCEDSYPAIIKNKVKGSRCSICTGRYVTSKNSLFTLNGGLASEWHPTKNGNLTPHDVTENTGQKVWWIGKCGHEWSATVASRNSSGTGCPYCAGQKVCIDNCLMTNEPNLAVEWNYNKNNNLTPYDVVHGSGKIVWWVCKHGHEWEACIVRRRDDNLGCPYCSGRRLLVGFNDMWTTNPKLAAMLNDPNDGYVNTQSNSTRVDWKCPKCNDVIRDKSINHISGSGLSCPNCSDGISYPEKVMYHILKQLNINFKYDTTMEWSNRKRYDFYLSDYNTIIEMHGKQHYENNSFESLGGRSLEEEQENDKYKRNMAFKNDILHYEEIDARESDFDYIKLSILNSNLSRIIEMTNINWTDIFLNSKRSVHEKIIQMISDGHSIREISNETKLHSTTVSKTLKKYREKGLLEELIAN